MTPPGARQYHPETLVLPPSHPQSQRSPWVEPTLEGRRRVWDQERGCGRIAYQKSLATCTFVLANAAAKQGCLKLRLRQLVAPRVSWPERWWRRILRQPAFVAITAGHVDCSSQSGGVTRCRKPTCANAIVSRYGPPTPPPTPPRSTEEPAPMVVRRLPVAIEV